MSDSADIDPVAKMNLEKEQSRVRTRDAEYSLTEKGKETLRRLEQLEAEKRKYQMLSVVGHCPKCGAPIYGPSLVNPDEGIKVRYSCPCATTEALQKSVGQHLAEKQQRFDKLIQRK